MASALRLPDAEVLEKVLCQVLENFAYLSAAPAPASSAAPHWALSVRAALPDAGWLVLNGTMEMARQLAEASTGGPGDGLERDALAELCNLSASHLVTALYADQPGDWKAFVPEDGLPAGSAAFHVRLDVEGQPLEASYWRAA